MLCFLALISLNASAKIWRVNNTGLPADFTTIQAAHDAVTVMAGDTLQIEPSSVSYNALVSAKKLIILGPGYFLNLNPNQQANPTSATMSNLTLNSGSGGTVISGLKITGTCHISTGNITISRNNIDGYIYLSRDYSYSNVLISGNYGIGNIENDGNSGVTLITNVLIVNNHFSRVIFSNQCSGVIANNIFNSTNAGSNFIVKNNIFTTDFNQLVFIGSNNTISNNLSAAANGLPAGNGNQNAVLMTTVFVGDAVNSTDGQWQLKEGSPAKNAGLNGEDCGMYGGSEPYHLSGLPKIPSIYFLSSPSNSNGNSLPVTISVKTNN